jgi:hypothetical protein
MMNRYQDLMRNKSKVRLVIDTVVDKNYVQIIDGIVTHSASNYIEAERDATADEKAKYGKDKVRVIIPISRISQVICYENC